MAGLERWQDAISQNIANSGVAGYKAIGVAISSGKSDNANTGNDFASMLSTSLTQADAKVSFGQGQLVPTGNAMDCAIDGPGFFQVSDENGGIIYTRNGQFHADSSNRLVDSSGRPVVGAVGPITVTPGGGDVRVEADGSIYQKDVRVAQLAVVSIADESALVPAGGGYAVAQNKDPGVQPMANVHVVQGVYEASNVSPMREMINMINVSRAYEANQKVLSSQDAMLGKVVSTFAV